MIDSFLEFILRNKSDTEIEKWANFTANMIVFFVFFLTPVSCVFLTLLIIDWSR